jgi:hypothetical protein
VNEGEAIGLLVGTAIPPNSERPLLLQSWDWTEALIDAIDASADEPVLREMVREAVGVILDFPDSDAPAMHTELIARRNFNDIRRKGGKRD